MHHVIYGVIIAAFQAVIRVKQVHA